MTHWFDVREALPGLRGFGAHVLPASREAELRRVLEEAGFRIATLEGHRALDEASFFREAGRALRLPEHFGHNWDALDECLHELGEGEQRRLALVWRAADRSLAADLQAVLDALRVLGDAARDLGSDDPPTQLEVFLLEEGRP